MSNNDELVYASMVNQLFRISDETRRQWKLIGFLVPDKPQINAYRSSTINQLLARQSRGFETPPTVADLMSGEVVLITTPEVCKRLNMSSFAVNTLLRNGHLAAVKLIANWRVSEASVIAYDERRNSTEFLTRAQVQHILSISHWAIIELLNKGRLETQKVEGVNGVRTPITRVSLLRLLRELLPDWIDEGDWLEDRLESKQPLLAQYTACKQLGITVQEFWALVEARRIQTIARFSGPGVRVPAESIEAYLSYSGHLITVPEIARLYGVSEAAVYRWYERGQIPNCPIPNHGHENPNLPYGSCWLAILEATSSPGFQSVIWYQERISARSTNRTLSLYEMAQQLNMDPQRLAQLALEGEIVCLRTITGQWRFSTRILQRKRPIYNPRRRRKR